VKIVDYIQVHAARQPDHPAVIAGEVELSYAELVSQYQCWANVLMAEGLGAGDRLGIALRDNADYVLAVLAAAHMGVVVVPIDWRAPAPDKSRIAEMFSIRLLLVDRPGTIIPDISVITVDDVWRKKVAASDPANMPCDPHEGRVFVILLSSGTTGTPKGAIVSHSDFIQRMLRNLVTCGSLADMRYLSVMPLSFSGGFNFCFLHLIMGNTVILHPPLFSPQEIVEVIKQKAVNFVCLVPTVLRWLLEFPEQQGLLFPDVRILMTTGGHISDAEKRAIVARINPNYIDNYASAAAGQIAAYRAGIDPDAGGSVGRAHSMVQVEVVDAAGSPVSPGIVGRLRCWGPGISRHFEGGDVDTTNSEGLKDGWYYTGDLAECDNDGNLFIRGRADDVIIKGGVNIYPKVMEEVLLAHPQIVEAAVVGRICPIQGQEVAAFVKLGSDVSSSELTAYCLQKMPANTVPGEFHFIDEFPRTAAGKIRKTELLKQILR
jgi:acyl-CoA synthetase (AMP-forming)/AMP-acid ligase II